MTLLTEREAAECWCPFAQRMPYGNAADAAEISLIGVNPEYADEMAAQFPCIGPRCMAWRGQEKFAFKSRADEEFRRSGVRLAPSPDDLVGYCGLAGKP